MVQGLPEPQGKAETVVRNPGTHLSVPPPLPFLHRPRSSPLKRDEVLVAPGPWASSCVLKAVSRKAPDQVFSKACKISCPNQAAEKPMCPISGKTTLQLLDISPGAQRAWDRVVLFSKKQLYPRGFGVGALPASAWCGGSHPSVPSKPPDRRRPETSFLLGAEGTWACGDE